MNRPRSRSRPRLRTSIHTVLLHAALALSACAVPLAAQLPAEAGFVVSKDGEWFVSSQPSEPLSIGQVVREGDVVWAGAHGATEFLNIALYAGGGRFELRCSVPGRCDERHAIPADAPREGWFQELLIAVRPRIGREPRRYVPSITRNRPSPQEAILSRDSAGVDLAPALARIPAGTLRLEAAALDASATPTQWHSLEVPWTPGTPAIVAPDRMPPGLYALRLQGQGDATGWVLALDASAGAPDAAGHFREFSARVRAWPGGAGYTDARMVLRAVLHHLAQQDAASGPVP